MPYVCVYIYIYIYVINKWPTSRRGESVSQNLPKILTFAVAPLMLTPFVRNQISILCCILYYDMIL